jgi:hypothetical protein
LDFKKEKLKMRMPIGGSFITVFLVVMVFSASAAIDPNMILYYSFDEQIDGRQVEDLTGGGNHGKLKLGAKLTDVPEEIYKGAGAVKFTNISAQVRVEPFKRMNEYNEHTYAFWIYIFSNTAKPWNWEHCGAVPCGEGRASIMEKGNILEGAVKGWAPGILIQEEPLALIYQFQDKGGGGLQGALGAKGIVGPGGNGTVFDLKTWYHIAGVKKASELIIYVDGKERVRYDVPRDFKQGEAQLRIGGTRERAASFAMDEFGLYDRALTAKEVSLDAKGTFLSVEPQAKLTTTWGRLKTGR